MAENEPNIDHYFVRAPYYDPVDERGQRSTSLILFGARGAGKSATRLKFYKEAWGLVQAQDKTGPLAITIDGYSRVLQNGLASVSLGAYVRELGYLTTQAILTWLSALKEEDRNLVLETMTAAQRTLAVALIQHFYLSQPEPLRRVSGREASKLLNQAWRERTTLWVQSKWDAIVGLMAAIADKIISKSIDSDLSVKDGLESLLTSDPKQWDEALFARELFSRLVEFARSFGFSGITVLVDKADETQETSDSAASTARLLFPLLSTTQLLEIDGLGWLFFLWDALKEPYNSAQFRVRLDKIAHAEIEWEETYLRDLVARRLRHFSGERVHSFAGLCEPEVNADSSLVTIARLAMRSPRELIRILDTIVREHDEEFANQEQSRKLLHDSIDRGLDRYVLEAAVPSLEKKYVQQIVKLGMVKFLNRDVQTTFRISSAGARNRILAWADAGLVTQTGTRASEGTAGGQPAHEYSLVDSRLRRVIERKLSLGMEYDLPEDDYES